MPAPGPSFCEQAPEPVPRWSRSSDAVATSAPATWPWPLAPSSVASRAPPEPSPEMPEDTIPYGSQSIWWIADASDPGNVEFDRSYARNAITRFPILDRFLSLTPMRLIKLIPMILDQLSQEQICIVSNLRDLTCSRISLLLVSISSIPTLREIESQKCWCHQGIDLIIQGHQIILAKSD